MSRNKTIILILAFLFIVGALSADWGREIPDEETLESEGSETEPEPEPEPEPKEPEWHRARGYFEYITFTKRRRLGFFAFSILTSLLPTFGVISILSTKKMQY